MTCSQTLAHHVNYRVLDIPSCHRSHVLHKLRVRLRLRPAFTFTGTLSMIVV